jgi:hypothetical protein
MANELLLSVNLAFTKNNITVTEAVSALQASVTGNGLNSLAAYSAPTADTALPLGSVSAAGGWLFMQNTDQTNYVTVKVAVGGAIIARLRPGYCCLIPLDPSTTAPSTQANTAICVVKFAIFDL